MYTQRLTSNHLFILGKLTLNAQNAITYCSKRTRKTLIGSTIMRLQTRRKKRLSSITSFLLINLRLRPPKYVKVGEKALQPLGSIPSK